MDKPKHIAIIGGGWAGLACAEKLLSTVASSLEVTLFESAPMLGGRARGLTWTTDRGQTIAIDNGQHLTIGAYTETFALLARAQAPAWEASPLIWSGIECGGQIAQRWKIPDAAWPWRVIAALLPPQAPKDWPLHWRTSLALTLLHLLRHSWQADHPGQTAAQWLVSRKVPQGLIEHFWQPLIEGALNTEISAASAAVSLRVLKDSMAGPRGATRVLVPSSDLSKDGIDPIAQSLQSQGLRILRSHPVLRMHADARLEVRESNSLATHDFDAVVLACPHHASLRLWESSGLAMGAAQKRWQSLQTRAITTVWVAMDAASVKRTSHLPSWFILHRVPNTPHMAQVVVKRKDAIALVISAQQGKQVTHASEDVTAAPDTSEAQIDEPREALAQQLSVQLGIDIRNLPQKWITEKRATWACTADAPMAQADEALGYTGMPRIFRAADDLEPGYPATIESAVRSGQRTATTLLRELLA